MPWNMNDYPDAFKNFDHVLKKKIIDIANGMLANGYKESEAIPIAIDQGKEWIKNASKEEVEAFKYGPTPKKDDSHATANANSNLLDQAVMVYYADGEWVVKTKHADQAANRFQYQEDAIERAQEIASNKEVEVIVFTKDGKRKN